MPTCPEYIAEAQRARLPAMACYDSDDSWPIGPDLPSLNASFTSSRNFFSGALFAGSRQTNDGASVLFRSRRASRTRSMSWLLAAVDGTGASARRRSPIRWWKSWVGAATSPACAAAVDRAGKFWRLRRGDGRNDAVRAFEIDRPRACGRERASRCERRGHRLVDRIRRSQRRGGCRTISKRGDMKPSGLLLLAAVSLSLAVAAPASTRPHYGGTLRVAIEEAPASLDPADSGQPGNSMLRPAFRG